MGRTAPEDLTLLMATDSSPLSYMRRGAALQRSAGVVSASVFILKTGTLLDCHVLCIRGVGGGSGNGLTGTL